MIREHLKGRTEALEDLAVELLARGLSVRDIEDASRDETGRLLLSKTAVSEIGERLWADYQEFATRDLGDYAIAYLFVDGIAEHIRPGKSASGCWPPGVLRHLAPKCFCIGWRVPRRTPRR